jgi:hypothetical protein
MNDLLKEAIADAKAVRTTALANAKLALEEAFTPKLQSMISAKIREEAEHDDMDEMREDDMEDHNEMREDEHDMVDEMEDDMEEGGMREDEHDMEEGGMREDEHEMEEDMEDEMTEMDDEIEMEGHHEGMREDEHEMDEPVAEEDDLELEAIIKELEDEIEEDEHELTEEDELEESNDASSGIGGSDNKQPAPAANADSTDDPEGTGAKVVAESEDGMEGESETLDNLHEEEGDELEEGDDIDLEEVIRSLREEEEELEESEDGMEGESETINNLTEKLKESYSVVKFLRSKINEVNLLNAKLLFTNKLFRNGNLNEGQKLKVIETFDRAKSTREVKLVYTTLAESTMATRTSRRTAIKEGFASKAVGSTKPRKAIISVGADMASRFKKLAGLTK